ncbi:hypothetical protein pb186bvf_000005 [Paramecium bursaria]
MQNLRYGYIVRITCNYEYNAKGCLTSKGFIDTSVYFQSYDNLKEANNFRECLFQILPRGSFEIHDEYEKLKTEGLSQRLQSEKEQYNNIVKNKLKEEVLLGSEIILKHLESGYYLVGSDDCSDTRTDSFKLKLQENLSSQIIFRFEASRSHQKPGRPIFDKELLKIQSEQTKFWIEKNLKQPIYLDKKLENTDMRPSLRGKSQDSHRYEAIISHNSTTNWYLKINNDYDQTQEFHRIKNNDLVSFRYTNDTYLGVDINSKQCILKKAQSDHIPVDSIWEIFMKEQVIKDSFDEPKKGREKQKEKDQNSPSSQTSQKYHSMKEEPDQSPQHINLPPRRKKLSDIQEITRFTSLMALKGPKKLKSQIEIQAAKQIVAMEQKQTTYYFKHFLTGEFLIKSDYLHKDDYHAACLHADTENKIIEIQLADVMDKELVNGSFINISSNSLFLQLVEDGPSKKVTHFQQKSSIIVGVSSFFKQLIYSEDKTYKCGFRDNISQDQFIINKISPEYIKEILYPLSSCEILSHFVDVIKTQQQHFTQIISPEKNQFILFCLKKLISYIAYGADDPTKKEAEITIRDRKRQLIMKDQFFIEILVEILYNISYKNGSQKLQLWKYQRDLIKEIFKSTYFLLTKLIYGNSVTKLYASQWLELFLHQYIMINEPFIQTCLSEILNDNAQAIKIFLNQNSIARIIDIISSQIPHEKFLNVLSSICVCNDNPLQENQQHVLQLFFLKIGFDFGFKFRVIEDNVHVLCPILKQVKFRQFQDFYNESLQQDDLQQWNYFLSYFKLLGEVCMKRNKQAQKFVEEHFPLEILNKILQQSIRYTQFNILSPFIDLVRYAYIDASPFEKTKIISRVIYYDALDIEHPKLSQIISKDSQLRNVLDLILKFLQDFDTLEGKSKDYSINLNKILKTLKTTIQQGFWDDQDELRTILYSMYKVCNSIDEFMSQMNRSAKEQLSYKSLEIQKELSIRANKQFKTKIGINNNLIIDCKQTGCEIIHILYDIENNIRIFKAAQFFKNVVTQYQIHTITKKGSNPLFPKQRKSLTQQSEDEAVIKPEINKFANKFKESSSTADDKILYDPNNWIKAFRNIIDNRKIMEFECFELVFVELSFFQNPFMLKHSLEILKRSYGQRKDLIFNFEKILIVAQGATKELSQLSGLIYSKLEQITELSFFELYKEGNKNIRNSVIWYQTSDPVKAGLLQNLYYIGNLMKKDFDKGRSLNPNGFEFIENSSQIAFCEREQNYRLHQSLLFSQEIHGQLIEYIRLFNFGLPVIYWKLLSGIYNYLTLLIWNHMENKMALAKSKDLMITQLDKNVGVIDFLKVLFTNNKPLLFSEREIPNILDKVLLICNSINYNQYYKSKLFEFLRVLLIFNSRYIQSNQNLSLQKIQESKYQRIILLFDDPDESESVVEIQQESFSDFSKQEESVPPNDSDILLIDQVKDLIEHYQESYQKLRQGNHEIDISPELSYFYTFFAIFSQLIEDNHKINLKKCRRMHSYNQLITLLSVSEQCWPLKRHLRAYLNRLYYTGDVNISLGFIKTDIYTILDDLQNIIDIKSDQAFSFMNLTIIQNPIRYKYLITYIYLYLEELLLSLYLVFNNEQFLEDFEESLLSQQKAGSLILHFQLFDLTNKLIMMERYYHQKHIGQLSRLILNILKCIFNTFDMHILLIREQLYKCFLELVQQQEKFIVKQVAINNQEQFIKTVQLERGRELKYVKNKRNVDLNSKSSLIDQLFSVQVDNDNEKQNASRLVKLMKPKQKVVEDVNESLNHKLKRIINVINLSGQFQQFLEEEFLEVCSKMSEIEQQSLKAYDAKVTHLKDYIENIINSSVNIEIRKILSDDLRIFFLKMLSRLITEKNLNNKDKMVEVDLWTSEYWTNYKDEIEKAQNFLVDCKAADLLYQLFMEQELEIRLSLLNESLAFCIAFLIGGNSKCQQAFLQKFKDDQNNTVLNNFSTIIKKLTKVVQNNFSILTPTEQESKTLIQTVDNYDFYDLESGMMIRLNVVEPDDAKETAFKKLCLDVICRFFRVLQLLCENNNKEMKKFLLQQVDYNGKPKLNSINFIEFTSAQLRIYMRILSRAIIIIPSSIMDFLIEIIQLPCVDNQINLCHTTFFEDVSHMSKVMSDPKNQKPRLFETQEDFQELHELQNKILVAVLSVLEGNNEKIFKDLENKLEAQFLVQFLEQNLISLGIRSEADFDLYLQQQDKIFNQDMLRILNVCIIKKKVHSFSNESKWIQQFKEEINEKKDLHLIYYKLSSLIRNIEIVYSKKSMTIFFPYHPIFKLLSLQTQDELMFTVNRETQRDKLLGMLEQTDSIFYELEHNFMLNHMKIPITQNNIDILQQLASLLTILINLLMIACYTVLLKENTYMLTTSSINNVIIKMLCMAQLLSQIAHFIMFSVQRIPIMLDKKKDEKNKLSKLITVTSEGSILLLFVLVLLSFYGTFFNTYIFVIHVVEIFSRNPLLKNVFQAISQNAKQLQSVALLGVLFVFAFSVISFSVYFDDIYQEQSSETCDSLITCMITLITSGVIGNSMVHWDPLKFFFDMTFTVFFGLLFTNIISGIMIDTFAELRDQRQKIEEDMKNICFICAAQRTKLEKTNKSFEDHTQNIHYIWNYIFYIKCLKIKDWTEYTGLEYWITEMLDADDISWFPESVEEEGQNVIERLDKIENLIQKFFDE